MSQYLIRVNPFSTALRLLPTYCRRPIEPHDHAGCRNTSAPALPEVRMKGGLSVDRVKDRKTEGGREEGEREEGREEGEEGEGGREEGREEGEGGREAGRQAGRQGGRVGGREGGVRSDRVRSDISSNIL